MQQRLGGMSALAADSARRGTFIFREMTLAKKAFCVTCLATCAKRRLFVAVVMVLFQHAERSRRARVRRSRTQEQGESGEVVTFGTLQQLYKVTTN